MAGIFQFGFHRLASGADLYVPVDIRWSLSAIDPSAHLASGVLKASDRAEIPYRLWQSPSPRALALLLHGACDYSGAFDEFGPKLASRGITALAFDQRGFGATRSRGGWKGRRRMTKDAIEAIRFLRGRFGGLPVFIIGESMGAAIAVHAAARAPELPLAGLVLVAPGAVASSVRRTVVAFLLRLLNRVAPDGEIVFERLSAWELTPSAAVRLLSDPLVSRGIRPSMMFGLLELAANAVDVANRVRTPTLTMLGTREDILRKACVADLHRALKGHKEWHVFENGPHLLLHWKHADRVNLRIFDFIDARLRDAGKIKMPPIGIRAEAQTAK